METSFSGQSLSQVAELLQMADQSPTECDGCTYLVSHLLTQAEIPHLCRIGTVIAWGKKVIPLHFWAEIVSDQGSMWRVDYRCQYWFGKEYPHGIVLPQPHHPLYLHNPEQQPFGGLLPEEIVQILVMQF